MKKYLFVCLLYMISLAQGLLSDETYSPCCSSFLQASPTLEIKGGVFFFSNSKMRKIYNNPGAEVQVVGTYPILDWVHAYGSVGYQRTNGKSTGDHQRTFISKIPVNLGFKAIYSICPITRCYIALGPRYFYLHQHNESRYVNRNICRNGLGGFVNTGISFFPKENLLLDLFLEYSYEKIRPHSSKTAVYRRNIQVGGITIGAGVGHVF